MKPRLFLFDSRKDYYGEIILDLSSLNDREFHFKDTQYFIDIGFRAPTPTDVEHALDGCPAGVYCSGAFRDGDPGERWSFSKEIKNEPNTKKMYAITQCPLKNFDLDQEKFSELQLVIDANNQNHTNKFNSFVDVGDVELSNVNFSVRTRNVLKAANIVFLSDLLQSDSADLLNIQNSGRKTVNEIQNYLKFRGLDLDSDENVRISKLLKDRKTVLSAHSNDQNSTLNSMQVTVPDMLLQSFDFSVRTRNIFLKENINYVSELVKWNEPALLRIKNFGRKSLSEIKLFLTNMGLSLGDNKTVFSHPEIEFSDPETLVGQNFFEDVLHEIQSVKDQRQKDILLSRFGFPAFLTLEEIGEKYSVTRERIRQLESKGLDEIFRNRNNKLRAWYQILTSICLEASFPIEIQSADIVDQRLKNENYNLEKLIKKTIYWTDRKGNLGDKKRLFIVGFGANSYLSHISQEDLLRLNDLVEKELSSVERVKLLTIKNKLKAYVPETQMGFFNLIWQREIKNCLIVGEHTDEDSLVVVKYIKRSKIERTVQLIIEKVNASDFPLRREDFTPIIEGYKISHRSVSVALQNNDEIFPIRHGLWATFKHLKFTKNDQKIILNEAAEKIKSKPNLQFHTREIEEKIKDALSTELNYFAITAILTKFGDFKYLGRNVFVSSEADIEQRYFIHQAAVNVLRSNNRIMHIKDIFQEASELVSIHSPDAINISPPMVNLGDRMIALDYWEID
ncbi:hypothetical protein N8914_06705 [Planktomarina temperata]|nr:hypothetical protein [Planktomarina temperata]